MNVCRLMSVFLASVPLFAAGTEVCDLSNYKAQPGLAGTPVPGGVSLLWDGEPGQELRLRLEVENGSPVIRELAARKKGGQWRIIAAGVSPEFRIVSGMRRISNQQLEPLDLLGVKITPQIIDEQKWEAFWDAPLDIPGLAAGTSRANASGGFTGNLPRDLPRNASEIHRAAAVWQVSGCQVKSSGSRLEVLMPGVTLGVFKGALQFSVYKGTNLIRQELIAKTDQQSVAYKYDAGLSGLSISEGSRVAWRDGSSTWQNYQFGGSKNDNPVALKASNRVLIAEQGTAGSIGVFPPPHTFFWAREIETNLGYNWYRKDNDKTYSFGIRQAEKEEGPQYQGNFALYSAPPGTEQHMAVYLYPSIEASLLAHKQIMAFTRDDHFKALPGYQVMAHHYHMDLGERLLAADNLDLEIPDLEVIRSIGVNIVSQLSSVFGGGRRGSRPDELKVIAASVEGARRHSDKGFLVMPNQEFFTSPVGGHVDLIFSHPVYWTGRAAGQPFTENVAPYGKVYRVGSAEDLMSMVTQEDILLSMPHPRTKGSTGYPDAVKDKDYFKVPNYQGVGYRWGMGLDLSEKRLCDHRCLNLLDDMSNWLADEKAPLKYLAAITETRFKGPGDEVYSASPVNYLKLDRTPGPDDVSPVIKAMMKGDYFVTSGEVLIRNFVIEGAGANRAISADLEWTFPMEFVEVVWGDGKTSGRQMIPATELAPFGRHHYRIPFDAAGKKWVRFAAWDSAGNGALTQPVRVQ